MNSIFTQLENKFADLQKAQEVRKTHDAAVASLRKDISDFQKTVKTAIAKINKDTKAQLVSPKEHHQVPNIDTFYDADQQRLIESVEAELTKTFTEATEALIAIFKGALVEANDSELWFNNAYDALMASKAINATFLRSAGIPIPRRRDLFNPNQNCAPPVKMPPPPTMKNTSPEKTPTVVAETEGVPYDEDKDHHDPTDTGNVNSVHVGK